MRYIGFKTLCTIIKAVSLYADLWAVVIFVAGALRDPRSVTLINWLAAILMIGGRCRCALVLKLQGLGIQK